MWMGGFHSAANSGLVQEKESAVALTAAHELRTLTWDRPLYDRAASVPRAPGAVRPIPAAATNGIAHATAICDQITRTNSRTFYLASSLAPKGKRAALRSLYALCRLSDDIVDSDHPNRARSLDAWRELVLGNGTTTSHPVLLAWSDTCARFDIPTHYVAQLLDTLAMDLSTPRFRRFEQLAEYCYGVASTVGLLAMHIVGYAGLRAIPYAVKLGVALQLTNILRDVGEDWRRGRLYLPLEELVAYGLTEADIASGCVTDRWRAFMRFQVGWNRRLYADAVPGIALLDRDGQFPVAAAAYLYQAILSDIERHDYDVFNRRAHIGDLAKLRLLPRVWMQTMRTPPPET
jgi:15-cis-phytoene synthase